MKNLFQKLRPLFARERLLSNTREGFSFARVACRLILAWCCFVLTTLDKKGAFVNLSWLQETSLGEVGLSVLGFFVLFSLVAVLVGKINTDALFLLFASSGCVFYWCSFPPSKNVEWFLISVIFVYALFVIWCTRALANVWEYVKMHTTVMLSLVIVGFSPARTELFCTYEPITIAPSFERLMVWSPKHDTIIAAAANAKNTFFIVL